MGGFVRMFNPNLMVAAEAGRMIRIRNFEILWLDVPQQVTSRFGPDYFGRVREGLLREASALPLCMSMLRLPMIGIG